VLLDLAQVQLIDHPRMMTKVLVYDYCVGVFSSRRMEKRLVEDITCASGAC